MESQPAEPLAIELRHATGVLKEALDEACGAEVTTANTGQLMRVEEVLLLAAEAAQKAVSIRRRVRHDRSIHALEPGTLPLPTTTIPDAIPDTHRLFVDADGLSWDIFAVHPSGEATAKARLPEPYQNGWLSFDSGTDRRRLSPIPPEWRSMTHDALRELCGRAEPVPKRATPPRPNESS